MYYYIVTYIELHTKLKNCTSAKKYMSAKADKASSTDTAPKTPLDILSKIKQEEVVEQKPKRKIVINMPSATEEADIDQELAEDLQEKELAKALPATKPVKQRKIKPKTVVTEIAEPVKVKEIRPKPRKARVIAIAKPKQVAAPVAAAQVSAPAEIETLTPKKVVRVRKITVRKVKLVKKPEVQAPATLLQNQAERSSAGSSKLRLLGVDQNASAAQQQTTITAQQILDLKPEQLNMLEGGKREVHNLLKDLKIITAILLGKKKNKELSQVLDTDKSFTSKQIKELEEKGLVKREGEGKETEYAVDQFNVMKFLQSKVVVKWKSPEKDKVEKTNVSDSQAQDGRTAEQTAK